MVIENTVQERQAAEVMEELKLTRPEYEAVCRRLTRWYERQEELPI